MEAKEITDEDLRRIHVYCRCGTQSIAEVAEPLAVLINVHVCPNCRAIFTLRRFDGNWKIERIT
jgi:hypothetical protein